MFNRSRLIIVIVFVGFLLALAACTAPKAAEGTSTLDGSIPIPADLRSQWDDTSREYEQAQTAIRRTQPLMEQILRITLDRAGVKPENFDKYEFDVKAGSFKKKTLQSNNSSTPPAR